MNNRCVDCGNLTSNEYETCQDCFNGTSKPDPSIPISKLEELIAVWEEEAKPPHCEYSAEDFIKDLKNLKISFRRSLLPIEKPEINKPVKAVIKHWNNWSMRDVELIAVDEGDCDWRFVECKSELAHEWNVIYWEYKND